MPLRETFVETRPLCIEPEVGSSFWYLTLRLGIIRGIIVSDEFWEELAKRMIIQKEGNIWNKNNNVWETMSICAKVLVGVVTSSFKPRMSAGRLINSIVDGEWLISRWLLWHSQHAKETGRGKRAQLRKLLLSVPLDERRWFFFLLMKFDCPIPAALWVSWTFTQRSLLKLCKCHFILLGLNCTLERNRVMYCLRSLLLLSLKMQ